MLCRVGRGKVGRGVEVEMGWGERCRLMKGASGSDRVHVGNPFFVG